MPALLSYLHAIFMRSYRYAPASFVYIGWIAFIYTVVPNPVMDSYSFSASFLFVIAAVLCYTFIDLESGNQEYITTLHCGSLLKLYIAKLLYCWLFTVPFALYAVLYPFLFDKFNREPTLEELCFAFVYHVVSALLGVVIASWFSSKFIQSRLMSFLSLTLLIVLTLTAQGIHNELPKTLKFIAYLLPPQQFTMDVLTHYDTASWLDKLMPIGATILYSIIVAVLLLFVLLKRKLDSPQS